MKTVYIASDHGGFYLKQFLVEHMTGQGHDVHDLGPADATSMDYPAKAAAVADRVLNAPGSLGILVCGTGLGMSIAANRVKGIRAALATTEFHAKMGRAHNNANVLCLGERVTGTNLAASIVDTFLSGDFDGGRHQRRIDMLD